MGQGAIEFSNMVKKAAEAATATKHETALREEEVLAFWKERHIFEETLRKKSPKGEFVFYDGPPFATGLPHYGSLLSSVIKDVIPRYKTMRGYHVRRRWGWDCHGLPIENLIEKRLGLKTKKDIEQIGIEKFNEAARSSVLEFEREWERYIDRIGRFVDFKHSYKTMDNSFMESVWWALKELYGKGLMYEGRKVLMYCSHCETPLAKAEIAMDHTYKDVTDEAPTVKFKVKNPEKLGLSGDAYLLAWTTTPWTLPGNAALAVGKDIEYVVLKEENSDESFVASLEFHKAGGNGPELFLTKKKFTGSELVGLEYEPLYEVSQISGGKVHTVLAGDFVSTADGTGIVHIAPTYGEDDYALGQKEGLPVVQLLDPSGHYIAQAPEFIQGKYWKQANKLILEDLESRGLVLSHAPYTHSYPHCHRCGTPLIYNAVPSWFINIQKIKERMLQENEHVNWYPAHLKHGRFKHNVENAPDWTISRNRYWASALPIWKEKNGNGLMVIGSLDELKAKTKRSGNRYFVVRHGEANHMLEGSVTRDPKSDHPLTQRGREQAAAAAKEIPRDKPIVMVVSPVLRAQQTAKVIASELGMNEKDLITDERLIELGFGDFEGGPRSAYLEFRARPDWYTVRPPGRGESLEDAKIRFGQALYDYESKYKDHTIVFVSHMVAFESLMAVCEGAAGDRLAEIMKLAAVGPAAVMELDFVPLPVNRKFELDLHRPYIDAITLVDEKGSEYERIPEVVDGWVESGAMPFAEYHYPVENREVFEKNSPADFIAEYIAQTRTWFYYLHALGVALFDRIAFRNVVSTGTIVAADGSKMSKSKGNYTDPLILIDMYGADALRLHLMGSIVMQGEDLQFRDEDVREAHNRVIGILWNSYKFFELYKNEYDPKTRVEESAHPLDRWIMSRLGELIREMTDALENYDTPSCVRALKPFIEDYSTWYVRRSRDRVKAVNSADKQYALATQRHVLLALSELIAPIMPFLAESLYKGVFGEKESVHLEDWPNDQGVDEKLIEEMALARAVASKALELRDRAGIKVRQPLALLKAKKLPENEAVRAIIADEVNVKSIIEEASLAEDAWLDTELTDELREEGMLRDVIRAIQDLRKKEGFSIHDRYLTLRVGTSQLGNEFFKKHYEDIQTLTGIGHLDIEMSDSGAHISGVPFPVSFTLEK